MTQSVPWSVKGIDRKARETAKDLARRSGLTLGEWLNQMIEDQHDEGYDAPVSHGFAGGGSAPLTEAIERLSARIEAAETRSTLAITGIDQSVRGLVARIEEAERNQTAVVARFEGVGQDIVGAQARLTDRLRRLEDEAAGPRSLEALRAMEGTVAKLAGRITDVEGGVQEALTGARKDAEELSARMENAETGAVGMIDAVVGGIAERIKNAEAGTTLALRGLESSLARLDQRLANTEASIAETAGAGASDEKLEQLAAKLSSRVEAVRQEMAAKLHASADGRIDRLDRAMSDMTRHVQEAERRSAQAMERMGHEVLRMADSLGRRVQTVETKTAEAVEQMGGEVARIADQLDSRFHRADNAQAMALEKLGSEIARITERLSERIANAERRSAQAIDDVGEQVSRVTERLNQRHDRAAGDLAERIRQSEERTAKLLEEARERIDTRLDVQRARAEIPAARAPEPAAPSPFADTAPSSLIEDERSPFGPEPYSVESFIPAKPIVEPEPPAVHLSQGPFGNSISFAPADFAPVEPDAPSAFETAELAEPQFDDADFDAIDPFSAAPQTEADFAEPEAVAPPIADSFEPMEPEADADSFEPEDDFLSSPLPTDNPGRPLSTRELIEQARARAREQASDKGHKPEARPSGGLPGISFKSKKRGNGKLKTGLLMGAAALCLGVVGYGWVQLLTGYDGGAGKPVIGPTQANAADATPSAPPAASDPADLQPRVALAFDPQPIEGAAPLAAGKPLAPGQTLPVSATPTPGPNPVALFNDAMAKVQAKDPAGLEPLRKAANLGYAPAQMQLGRLYESGQLGLPEDMGQARRWTQRAAEGGYPKAMYNLGLYMFNGEGGEKDLTQAAQWFRRSADLGLADGQYNLGVMYQKGYGVSKNPAEAYKWFMIASRNGDASAKAQAKAMADQVRGQISADAQAAADRSAGAYAAGAPAAAPVQLADAGAEMLTAQRALNKLGYYQGSMDGASTPATRQAIQAFQRDRGLPTTGALDPDTTQKLAPYAR